MFTAGSLWAQRSPMKMPKNYAILTKGVVCDDCKAMDTTGDDWVVYADRDNVPLYSSADGGSPIGKAAFRQPFYAVEERGRYLHLVDYMQGNAKDAKGKLKKEAKDYGWCRKEDLVMWSSGIANDKKVTIKLLSVIKDKDVFLNMRKFIKDGNFVRFYNSPDCKPENENSASMDMFQFLYLFKKSVEYDSYLVGISNKITGLNVNNVILGWVPARVMEQWGDRLCLQPNKEKDAAADRLDKGVKAALLVDEETARKYAANPQVIDAEKNKVTWSNDPYDKGWNINQKRLPIFNTDKSGIIQTGYVTEVVNEAGQTVLNHDKDAEARQAQGLMIEALRNINFVFVVDGGDNNKSFIPYVKDAINKLASDKANNPDVNNKLRFGVVVYRSEGDKDCPSGDLSVVKSKLSADQNVALEFLDQQIQVSACASPAGNRSVRKGIYSALEMLDGSKMVGQTSYVVMVGAAGDVAKPKDAKYSDENLGKMIAESQPHILVFQTINAAQGEFVDYTGNSINWVLEGSKEMVKRMNKADTEGKLPDGTIIGEAKWSEVSENSYKLAYEQKLTAKRGEISFPNMGANLQPQLFSTTFENVLSQIYTDIERQVEYLSFGVNSDSKATDNSSQIPPDVAILFTNNYPGVNLKELSSAWDPGRYQFFFKCYTHQRPGEKLKYDAFERVLFYTDTELDDLVKKLNSITAESEDKSDQRKKLKEAMEKILEGYYGAEELKTQRKELGPSDIMALIQGVKPQSQVFKNNIKLDDITNVNKFSEDDLNKMVGLIERKLKGIKSIKGNSEYFFRLNDSIFYWIPESVLP